MGEHASKGPVPRVVIVDDHPVVLHGLRDLLSLSCEVLRACGDTAAALNAIEDLAPDVVVLDITMPDLDGIAFLGRLRALGNETPVLFLTANVSDGQVADALALGASGIVLKESVVEDLADCVHRVAAGETCFPDWTDAALRRAVDRRAEADRLRRLLTPREREIMALVTNEVSNKGLARQLNLTEGTVKLHLHNIYEKLGITNRARLVDLALTLRDEA